MNYLYNERLDEIDGSTVVRIESVPESGNGWIFTDDPANRHYQEYLAWVAEGNTAEVIEEEA